MSKLLKIRLSICLLIVGLVCGIMAFAVMPTTKAEATTYTPSVAGDVIGADIRYDKNSQDFADTGLRFTYVVDKATSGISSLSDIYNMGVLVQRKSDLGANELTAATAGKNVQFYTNGAASATHKINEGALDANKQFVLEENGSQIAMVVYVYNVPSQGFASDFVCRGYVQIGESGTLQASTPVERSIKYVAKQAYSSGDYGDGQQAFLEYFLNEYTITFATGNGSAVAPVTLYEGSKLDANTTSTLADYEFDGWYEDGAKINLATYEVSKSTTLTAIFKKTATSEIYAAGQDLAITYEDATPVKIVYAGAELQASDYELSGTTLTLKNSALNDVSGKLQVYSSANTRIEYGVTAVDTTQPMTIIDVLDDKSNVKYVATVHLTADDRSDRTEHSGGYLTTTTDIPEGGVAGKYYKINREGYTSGLYLSPSVPKEAIEFYTNGNVKFDIYQSAVATEAGHYASLTGENVSSLVGWKTISIPVEDFVNNIYDNMSTDITLEAVKPFIMFGYSKTTRTLYLGNFRVEPYGYGQVTVSFDTGDGEPVADTLVYPGDKLDETIASTLEGYEFDSWCLDGAKVDLSTYTVNEAITLKALFKKDGAGAPYAKDSDLSIAHTGGDPVKVVFDGAELTANEDYEIDSGNLVVNKTALANKSATLNVYTSDYTYTSYTVTYVDTTQPMTFINIDNDLSDMRFIAHLHGESITDWTSGVEVVSNPTGGEPGNYYKLNIGTAYSTGLYVLPGLSKEILQMYNTGYVKFDVYNSGATTATGVNLSQHLVDGTLVNTNGWNTISIPVETFLANVYDKMTLEWDIGEKTAYDETPFIQFGYVADSTRYAYVGNFRVEPMEPINPDEAMPFVEINKANVKYIRNVYTAGTTSPSAGDLTNHDGGYLTVTSEIPEGGVAGNYFKIVPDGEGYGIYIKPSETKARIAAYVGGYVMFDLYRTSIGIAPYTNNGVAGLVEPSQVVGWRTVSIPVEDFVANIYDHMTLDWGTSAGGLNENPFMLFGSGNGTVYMGNFRVVSAENLVLNDDRLIYNGNKISGSPDYDFNAVEYTTDASIGNGTETVYKITAKTTVAWAGIKLIPALTKADLQRYAGKYMVVNYKITAADDSFSMGIMTDQSFTGSYKISAEDLVLGEWAQLKISVDLLLSYYDNMTQANYNSTGWPGRLITLYKVTSGDEFCFSGFNFVAE